MKLPIIVMLISLLALLGCDHKETVDSSTNKQTQSEPGTAAIAQGPEPVFQAEVFIESRSPDKGIIGFSRKLERTREEGENKTPKSWMEFELHNGSVCKIYPTFIKHRDGYDAWQFELNYVTCEEGDGRPRAAVSKEIVFDGQSPAVVAEDERHSVIVRPREETKVEQGDAGQPATRSESE